MSILRRMKNLRHLDFPLSDINTLDLSMLHLDVDGWYPPNDILRLVVNNLPRLNKLKVSTLPDKIRSKQVWF